MDQADRLRVLLLSPDHSQRCQGEEILLTLAPTGALAGISLQGIRLYRRNLSGADLRGSDLRGASLQWCTLAGADLRGADLRGVNLRFADLSGADLRGATTEGIQARFTQMHGVLWDVDHPVMGRQMPLICHVLPRIPGWFHMVHSLPQWQIRNVFAGRHPLGAALPRRDEPAATQHCQTCAHRRQAPWRKWRCARMESLRARPIAMQVRVQWRACTLWEVELPDE